MIPLHSLLASGAGVALATVLAIFSVAGVVIAFVIGSKKGFKKVFWGGLVWLAAGLLFLVLNLAVASKVSGLAGLILNVFLLLVCVSLGMAGYAFFARRHNIETGREEEEDEGLFHQGGFAYEANPEYNNCFPEYKEDENGQVITQTEEENLTSTDRFLGGAICAINVAMIVLAAVSFILLFVDATIMKMWNVGGVLQAIGVQGFLSFARNYALDFLMIGVAVAFAFLGWKTGFLRSLFVFVIVVGTLVVLCLSVGLPFSKFAYEWHFLSVFVARCESFASVFTARLNDVIGRAIASVCLALLGGGVVAVLAILAKKLETYIDGQVVNFWVDGVLGAVMFAAMGIVICVVGWAIVYAFDYCGIVGVGTTLSEGARLSMSMFDGVAKYVGHFLNTILSLV